jgi:hypothetical protein
MSLEASQPTSTEPVIPSAPRRRAAGLVNVALGLAVLVGVGGIAFAAGRSTAPSGAATSGSRGLQGLGRADAPFASGAPGRGLGGFGGGRSLQGTVVAVTSDTLTLDVANGSTIEVGLGGTTTYHRQAAAAAGDVTPGAHVLVRLDGGFRGTAPTGGGPSAAPSGPASGAGSGSIGTAVDVTVVP